MRPEFSSLQRILNTEKQTTTFGYVKMMRERFSQPTAESPAEVDSPPTGRLSPSRKEPWLRNKESSEPEHVNRGSNLYRRTHEKADESDGQDGGLLQATWAQKAETTRENYTSNMANEPSRGRVRNDENANPLAEQEYSKRSSREDSAVEKERNPPSPSEPRSPDHASPSQGRQHMPLNISAFNYALEPFLRANPRYAGQIEPPSPPDSSTSSDSLSPVALHSSDDAVTDAREVRRMPVRAKLPPIVANKNRLDTRIKVLNVKMTLMRCAVIDRAAWELERNAWKKGSTSVYDEYSKMYKLVENAILVAKKLRSDELQARCFYWLGRACGRQRYWDEAEQAFEKAIHFDTEIEENGRGKGLLPTERADVRFLKRSVQKRAQRAAADRKQRRKRDEEMAWKLAETRNLDFDEVVIWNKSPPWCPDTESAMRQWMQATGREIEASPQLDSDGEWQDPVDEDESLELEWVARPFTPEEIYYIEHGDNRQAPLTRQNDDSRSCFGSVTSKRGQRDRPLSIHTNGLRPIGLGIAVSGTSDEGDHIGAR
jgi:hypothetical protein